MFIHSNKNILEVACFNLESCLIAQESGADQIELCENYSEGGISPSRELIIAARQQIQIPIHVMIRPRPGNFIYNPNEINEMINLIKFCKTHHINGIVTGVLLHDNTIHLSALKEIVNIAKPMKITFHRAFDEIDDIMNGAQQLIDSGCDFILSSGKESNAIKGSVNLKRLQKKFGDQLGIIAGGWIRKNEALILKKAGLHFFHSSCITFHEELTDHVCVKEIKEAINC